MTDRIKAVSTNIEDVANRLCGNNTGEVRTIDGGDHLINLWRDSTGELIISVQGCGENATLLFAA